MLLSVLILTFPVQLLLFFATLRRIKISLPTFVVGGVFFVVFFDLDVVFSASFCPSSVVVSAASVFSASVSSGAVVSSPFAAEPGPPVAAAGGPRTGVAARRSGRR